MSNGAKLVHSLEHCHRDRRRSAPHIVMLGSNKSSLEMVQMADPCSRRSCTSQTLPMWVPIPLSSFRQRSPLADLQVSKTATYLRPSDANFFMFDPPPDSLPHSVPRAVPRLL